MNTSLRPIRISNSEGGDGARVLTIVSASSITALLLMLKTRLNRKYNACAFKLNHMM